MKVLLLTLLVGLFILLGIVLGSYLKKHKKFIDVSIGLAFGVMTILLLKEILPHAYLHLDENIENGALIIFKLVCSVLSGIIPTKLTITNT